MSDPISVALVGIGGYGNTYVAPLLDAPNQDDFRIVAAIDPSPSTCRRLNDLKARNIPMHDRLEEFLSVGRADLVVICSPLHLHARHTCMSLSHGSHVLCEKPMCVTPAHASEMAQARDAAKKLVAIGYQWSFSQAIQQLKADILGGVLGKPKRLRSLVLWPRDEAYYHRNRWAGLIQDARGNWVLDSPVNNACAHYLHNMLYLLGNQVDRSAHPAKITAELYRAHPIQNYDTAVLRCITDANIEILLVVSHATAESRGPVFWYEFERATVEFTDTPGADIIARFTDGATKSYGTPNEQRDRKLWQTMDAIRKQAPTVCGIEAAVAHTQCVWAAQHSTPQIVEFPSSLVHMYEQDGSRRTSVDGLGEALGHCYERSILPSELGVSWAKPAREVSVAEFWK